MSPTLSRSKPSISGPKRSVRAAAARVDERELARVVVDRLDPGVRQHRVSDREGLPGCGEERQCDEHGEHGQRLLHGRASTSWSAAHLRTASRRAAVRSLAENEHFACQRLPRVRIAQTSRGQAFLAARRPRLPPRRPNTSRFRDERWGDVRKGGPASPREGASRGREAAAGRPLGALEAAAGEQRWHDAVTATACVQLERDGDDMVDVFEDDVEVALDRLAWLEPDDARSRRTPDRPGPRAAGALHQLLAST